MITGLNVRRHCQAKNYVIEGDISVITRTLASSRRIVENLTYCRGSPIYCGVCDYVFICVAKFESLVYSWCCHWNYGDKLEYIHTFLEFSKAYVYC